MPQSTDSLLDSVHLLQQQLAFQDDLVERLDQAIATQGQRLLALEERVTVIQRLLREVRQQASQTASAELPEEPPPHY